MTENVKNISPDGLKLKGKKYKIFPTTDFKNLTNSKNGHLKMCCSKELKLKGIKYNC